MVSLEPYQIKHICISNSMNVAMIRVNLSNRAVHDKSMEFLPYQLLVVRSCLAMVLTGNGELGFDSGEGAWEMATTSKEGSRRVNYPIPTVFRMWRGSDNKSQGQPVVAYWNDSTVKSLKRNDWRTSLVPAPAVIPAPIVYIKVVAVKKLVVEFLIFSFYVTVILRNGNGI